MAPMSSDVRRRFISFTNATTISLLLVLVALEISVALAARNNINNVRSPFMFSPKKSLPAKCAWLTCSSSSSSSSSSEWMALRGGSANSDEDGDSSSPYQNATESDEKADAIHAALATQDDEESDEVLDMDNLDHNEEKEDDNAMDVRGGSSCESGACSGGKCGGSPTEETSTDEDEDVNVDDTLTTKQQHDASTTDAPIASVPAGGASDSSDEQEVEEPSNGHTAVVADHAQVEVEAMAESSAAVVTEAVAPAVEETPVAVEEKVPSSSSQPESDAFENDASEEPTSSSSTPAAQSDLATQVADAVATAEEDADAVVPQQIDDETARILIQDLKYRRYEVRGMQPHIAAIVVEKRLRRPQEGIPPSWYVDASKIPPAWRQNLEEWLPKLVLPVLVGGIGLSIYILHQKEGKPLSISIQPLKTWIKSIKPVRVSKSSTAVTAALVSSSEAAAVEAPLPSTTDATTKVDHDTHPHSIKPYVHEKPPPEEALDESWLDKLLTGISKNVKAIFRIKM